MDTPARVLIRAKASLLCVKILPLKNNLDFLRKFLFFFDTWSPYNSGIIKKKLIGSAQQRLVPKSRYLSHDQHHLTSLFHWKNEVFLDTLSEAIASWMRGRSWSNRNNLGWGPGWRVAQFTIVITKKILKNNEMDFSFT